MTTLTLVPYPATETYRENLCPNPSAEASTAGWSTASFGTVSPLTLDRQTDPAPAGGSYAFTLSTSSLAAGSGNGASAYIDMAAAPGQRHTAQAQMKWVAGWAPVGATLRLRAEYRSASAALLTTDSAPVPATQVAHALASVLSSAVAPAGTTTLRIYVLFSGGSASGQAAVRFDLVMVEASLTLGTYFDGSWVNDRLVGSRYQWNGTAHLSASRYTVRTPTVAATVFTPELVLDYSSARTAATTVHDVVDREDPVVVFGPLRTRRGTLDVWCSTAAQASVLIAMLATRKPVLLRDPDLPSLDMYFAPLEVPATPRGDAKERWGVAFTYVEVYGSGAAW